MSVSLFRKLFLFLFCAYSMLVVFPQSAYAEGWLEFFFPSLKSKEPDPSETLQAPFASPDDVVLTPTVDKGLPDNSTPLHIRHRPSADIALWLENTLPDLLSYDAENFKAQYDKKIAFLAKPAHGEYYKSLQDMNFLKTLETKKYDIKAFVQEIPMIMNEGDVEGRYRWLYKTRMMVTYVIKGATNYKLVKDEDTITQSLFVTVQVGRVNESDLPPLPEGMKNDHSVLIESFNAKIIPNKAAKKD